MRRWQSEPPVAIRPAPESERGLEVGRAVKERQEPVWARKEKK